MAMQSNPSNNGTPWPPDPAWQRAVQLAGEALYAQPHYRPTIHHGMELAAERAVMLYPDETTAVMDNGVRFIVDPAGGLCDCDYPGVELSWTLRGDDDDVVQRAQRVLRYLKILQGQPPALRQAAVAETVVAEPPAEAVAEPAAEAAAQPEPSPMTQWCELHKCNMKRRGQNGDYWYSHKVGDSWCRGENDGG